MRALRYPGVAQLVERVLWEHEAVSSRLATRTNAVGRINFFLFYLIKDPLSANFLILYIQDDIKKDSEVNYLLNLEDAEGLVILKDK